MYFFPDVFNGGLMLVVSNSPPVNSSNSELVVPSAVFFEAQESKPEKNKLAEDQSEAWRCEGNPTLW